MQQFAGVLAVCAAALLVTSGCGKKGPPRTVVGTWRVVQTPGDTWTFARNGAFTENSAAGESESGTYGTTPGLDSLDIRLESGDNVGRLKMGWEGDDTISLTGKNIEITLKR